METPSRRGPVGSVRMDEDTSVVLDLTLEMVYLLIGEAFNVVKKSGGCIAYGGSPHGSSGCPSPQSPSVASSPRSLIHPRNNDLKILELTKKINQLLTGEVLLRFEDVALYFSVEEWEYLEEHKDLYRDEMTNENHQPPSLLGESTTENAAFQGPGGDVEPNAGDKFPNVDEPSQADCPSPRSWGEELYEEEEEDPNIIVIHSFTGETVSVQSNEGTSTHQSGACLAGNLDPVKYPAACPRNKLTPSEWGRQSARNSELYPQRVSTGKKPCPCSSCGKCFRSRSELAAHMLTHASENSFICSECGGCFSSRGNLVRHRKHHTDGKPFLCSSCGKGFVDYPTLVRHQSVHAEGGKCFTGKSNLVAGQQVRTGERPFLCAACGKCFSRVGHLLRHQQTHTGNKPFSCSFCGKRFSSNSSLDLHERTHTGEKPFSCSHCGDQFNAYSSLIRHCRRHTGEKPYSCSDCGKRFAIKSNLVTHLRVHTGERPFACAECGKCFSYNSILVKHQRTHTGEKPFACSECGKCFSNQSNLVSHRRIHTGEKPFACAACLQSFTKKSSLIKHQKIHAQDHSGSLS